MQKIFYNASFLTMDKNNAAAEAVLVNDESIVFVGTNEEVLQMKNDETEVVDLKQKFIVPTFFDSNISVYWQIENILKTAKKDKKIENLDENDENYEKFCNFDIYKKEFLKIQDSLLSLGITTIQEMILNKQEFVFWKKISELGLLKIDVIGYVDIVKNKQIMDDNCRSYRKYKNGFRLGGYYINLDGSILEKRAWLKKAYPHEKGYVGYAEIFDEQLKIIIKTALEEKKQMMVFAAGNRSVEQFLRCYEEQITETKVEDNFRPVLIGCNFISKKNLSKMLELKIVPNFSIDNLIINYDQMKNNFGKGKLKKEFLLSETQNFNLNYLFNYSKDSAINYFEILRFLNFDNLNSKKILGKKNCLSTESVLKSLFNSSAYFSFDSEQKGSFESGKKADFLVLDNDILNSKNEDITVLAVYKNAELIYSKKKK